MNADYYRKYYRFEREHWWFKAREEILKQYIDSQIASKGDDLGILNIGAATGRSSEWLTSFGRVTSIEFENDCIEFVRDKLSLEIQQGSILSLDFVDDQFDLICAFDVIEHVEDDKLAVKEMIRVCKSGGHILLTVPAHMSLWSSHDTVNHHFRRYTLEQLESLFHLHSAGKIDFSSYFNTRLYPVVWLARKFSRLKQNFMSQPGDQSDFDTFRAGPLDRFFFETMAGERHALSKRRKLNKGVSILLHWKAEEK